MISLNKSITLTDKLSELDKESLKLYGDELGLTGLSALRKNALVQRVADRLLDPGVMFFRGAILSDKEMAALEKALDGPVSYNNEDFDAVATLNEMDFVVMSDDQYVVPCDVAKVWKEIKNEEFLKYRKKASWLWKCIYWAQEMYAVTPTDIMLELANLKKGIHFDEAEIEQFFDAFPLDRLWTIYTDDVFLSTIYGSNPDALESLLKSQADKEYYIPSSQEVEELYDTGTLLSCKEYKDLKSFLIKEFEFSNEDAEDMLFELWYKLSMENEDFQDALEWLTGQIEFSNDRQLDKFLKLFSKASNATRMLQNRGHKPAELLPKFGPGHMPIITAGSSHMAAMLQEAAPEIKRMGFDLDLELNAGSVPVFGFPDGINGEAVIGEKKVYPNDPCPCGSGKKYKKCCGAR